MSSGGPGGEIGSGPKAPISGPVAAASGVLSAPADDDLMGNTLCTLPFLLYGEGFEQSFKEKDWASWRIDSGDTFSGKFMVKGTPGQGYKDIQIRVVYSSASGAERRYRDFRFPEVPPEGSVFEVSVEKVGYGSYVDFLIMPRKRVPTKNGPLDDFTCVPADLPNFSEAWTNAGAEDVEKDLGLMAKFKIFTTLEKMEVLDRPIHPEVDFKFEKTP